MKKIYDKVYKLAILLELIIAGFVVVGILIAIRKYLNDEV